MRTHISKNLKTNVAGFNYDSISDAKTRKSVQDHSKAINKMLRQTAENIITIGRHLTGVKESIPLGLFTGWLYAEFRWSPRTAQTWMQAVERFGEVDCLEHFQASALVLLSPPNVPTVAVEEAVERARSGQLVSYAEAQVILRKHKPAPIRPEPIGVLERVHRWFDALINDVQPEEAESVADELERYAKRLRETVAHNSNGDGPKVGANGKPALARA